MDMTTRAISPRIRTAITGVFLAGALLVCVPVGTAFADDAGPAVPGQGMTRDIKVDRANIDTDRSKHERRRLDRDRGRLEKDKNALDDPERG
jgi:hypothetical protein